MDIRATPPPPPPPPPRPAAPKPAEPPVAERKPTPTSPLDPGTLIGSGLASAWDEELPDFGDLGLDDPAPVGAGAPDPRAGSSVRVPESEVARYALRAYAAGRSPDPVHCVQPRGISKEAFLNSPTAKAWPLPEGMTLESAWSQYAGRTGGNRSETPDEISNADFDAFFTEQVLPRTGGARAKNGAEALIGIADDETFINTACEALLGRHPGVDNDHLKNMRIMITRDHMSPTEARKEVIKALMGSAEYQAKQPGADFENLGYPMVLSAGGKDWPVMKQVQMERYAGEGLPFGKPLSQEEGINAILDHFAPFAGLEGGDAKGEAKGSEATQKLHALASITGDNFYFGYHEGANYPVRDTAHLGKDFPDLNVDLRRPDNENNCIRTKDDMKKYLETRVAQVKKLVSEQDPHVDSPRMLEMGQRALQTFETMLAFTNETMHGERSVLFKEAPGAKTGWFKNNDPAQPLASDTATIPEVKDEPRWMTVSRYWGAQFRAESASDPQGFANIQKAYWAP